MNLRRYVYNKLQNINIDADNLSAETTFILEKILNVKDIYLTNEITESEKQKLETIFTKRATGYPLQYIAGIAEFMQKDFIVNENVLIPRPETEILVAKTAEIAKQFDVPKILDIGSGSGCIAIMLNLILQHAEIFSVDISEQALELARLNAKNLKSQVTFIKSDLFENIESTFDIIVSNPPYIPPENRQTIQKEVSFEPYNALYTSDNLGIEFYEKIIKSAQNYMNQNAYLAFELGINQSDIVKNLFLEYNYCNIEIIKDYSGIDRVIYARKDK